MNAKSDPLRQLTALRESLEVERTQILERIDQINQVLDSSEAPGRPIGVARSTRTGRRSSAPRIGKDSSLADVVIEVTRRCPLSKEEILVAIKKTGYEFASKNPLNALGALLYSSKELKDYGGKFGPLDPRRHPKPARPAKPSAQEAQPSPAEAEKE